MNENIINSLKDIVQPFLDNVYLYFLFSVLLYSLGGVDDSLIGLFGLNIIDIVVCLISKKRSNKNLFINKVKIYIVIILGVTLDRLMGIDLNTVTRVRTYIILGYSYNEIVSILNTLCLDESFYLPKGIRSYIDKIHKKEMEYYNEQDE